MLDSYERRKVWLAVCDELGLEEDWLRVGTERMQKSAGGSSRRS